MCLGSNKRAYTDIALVVKICKEQGVAAVHPGCAPALSLQSTARFRVLLRQSPDLQHCWRLQIWCTRIRSEENLESDPEIPSCEQDQPLLVLVRQLSA